MRQGQVTARGAGFGDYTSPVPSQVAHRNCSGSPQRPRGASHDVTVTNPPAAEAYAPAAILADQRASRPTLIRADGERVRVLVVDDEVALTDLLSMALRYEGWQIRAVATGSAAVRVAKQFQPDAVILDVMLPDFDGLEIMRRLRAQDPNLPVLFLTARDAVEDRVAGLTAGGDDYVTKPFSLEELVARLRALMRRVGAATKVEERSILRVGDLELDEDSREVFRDGRAITLTATEFELLRYLMRNPRRVLSKAQ